MLLALFGVGALSISALAGVAADHIRRERLREQLQALLDEAAIDGLTAPVGNEIPHPAAQFEEKLKLLDADLRMLALTRSADGRVSGIATASSPSLFGVFNPSGLVSVTSQASFQAPVAGLSAARGSNPRWDARLDRSRELRSASITE